MARIESQAKAGFYPTPDSVCDLLQTKITFENGARIFDPCCGAGLTLSRLATNTTTTYGIELNHERSSEARSRLNHVLWGDALSEARISAQAFGLLYLNPPYDTEINPDEKSQRLETLFLRRYLGSLQLGGFLFFVIPYYVLVTNCAQAIARNFKVQVLGFPEKEFHAFKQCIVFGKRQIVTADQAQQTEDRLRELGRMEPDMFMNEVAALESVAPVSIGIPAPVKPSFIFKINRFDPLEGIPLVHKAGILKGALEELTPRKNNVIRPLTMLENGHLALMLAGGYMNGAVEQNGRQLVIKGVVRKVDKIMSAPEPGEKTGSITIRDKYIPTVKAIDMQTATMQIVQ